jgi:GDP/UDP-N,N'-diacetylbacillosamine 2-epimerase (hydrolysing)
LAVILAKSVIDCIPEKESIARALRKLYSEEFQLALGTVKNPYGEGGASKKIVEILQDHSLDSTLKKPFYNLV